MKMSDISQKLTERPGGFGSIMKARAKKQMPFSAKTRRAGQAEERLLVQARKIKDAFVDWKAQAFRSAGGEKAPISMAQFLGWIKKSQPKIAQGVESFARGEKVYAQHFSQAIDSSGKQTSTATDPKVKVRDKPHQVAGDGDNLELAKEPVNKKKEKDEAIAVYKKMGDELENKRKAQGGELVDEDEGDDENKAPVSASIYEARLRELLEAEDVGTNRTIVLKDNEIDTIITMGIEKQIELDGGESTVDKPEEVQSKSSSKSSSNDSDLSGSSASGDFLGEYQEELEGILKKVSTSSEFDKQEQRSANNMLYSL